MVTEALKRDPQVSERQSAAAAERQLTTQEAFHARTEALYQQLASSVERSLKQSIAEGVTASATATQPIVEATMAALSRETASLHDTVTQAMQRQIDGVSGAFQTTSAAVEATVASLSRETASLHESVTQAVQRQIDGLSGALQTASAAAANRSQWLSSGGRVRRPTVRKLTSGPWTRSSLRLPVAKRA